MSKYDMLIIIVCFTIMLIPIANALGTIIGYLIGEYF